MVILKLLLRISITDICILKMADIHRPFGKIHKTIDLFIFTCIMLNNKIKWRILTEL